MLQGLARWLRLLGFDTVFAPEIPDPVLIRRAVEESRIVLTQDRALPREWRLSGIHVVAARTPADQLREVARAFDLGPLVRPLTRCSRCNVPLESPEPGA